MKAKIHEFYSSDISQGAYHIKVDKVVLPVSTACVSTRELSGWDRWQSMEVYHPRSDDRVIGNTKALSTATLQYLSIHMLQTSAKA